jgi:NAD(P)-dependent dehydrogenase (short-subunit alcohol dehydrogenase family)
VLVVESVLKSVALLLVCLNMSPFDMSLSLVGLEQGAKVTAHYNTNQTTLLPLISQFGQQQIHTVQANLTEEAAVAELFHRATSSDFGEVQVLVLNHAIAPVADEPVWKMSLERWKHTIDTNLTSFFIVAKEYLTRLETSPAIVKDEASMVLIGSTAGKYG